jgi:hypothetical protein
VGVSATVADSYVLNIDAQADGSYEESQVVPRGELEALY